VFPAVPFEGFAMVPRTGFGRQAGLFEITFQGRLPCRLIGVTTGGIGTSETRNGGGSNHALPVTDTTPPGLRSVFAIRSLEGASMIILWVVHGHDGPATRAQ
jgi:hypothetical protein